MPIYEYRCKGCDHEFEEMQRITAEPHATCPSCGSEECRRLMSVTSFVLKGSGWYATDYGGKKGPATNGNGHKKDKGGEEGEAKAEKKVEKKAEKKADKKADKKPSESKRSS